MDTGDIFTRYQGSLKGHALDYEALTNESLQEHRRSVEDTKEELGEHLAACPKWYQDLLPPGGASKEWCEQEDVLQKKLKGHREAAQELEDFLDGMYFEPRAALYGHEQIARLEPELYQEHIEALREHEADRLDVDPIGYFKTLREQHAQEYLGGLVQDYQYSLARLEAAEHELANLQIQKPGLEDKVLDYVLGTDVCLNWQIDMAEAEAFVHCCVQDIDDLRDSMLFGSQSTCAEKYIDDAIARDHPEALAKYKEAVHEQWVEQHKEWLKELEADKEKSTSKEVVQEVTR